MIVNEIITELDREKKAQTARNIFMRFGLKKPISTVAGADADPYLVGFAGFANTPADVKFADAKWKFFNLKKKEDFVNAVKKMMADKTFTAAGGVTIYVDNSLFKKFPAYGDFLSMVSRMGGDKIRVEFKPESDDEGGEKGAGKKRVKAKWADPDAKVDPAEKQTTRYFTVTSPWLMNQLRRNDRVMQYYRPNKNAFVMGPKDFNAFVQAFGKDDIKIIDKFKEEISIEEQPNQNWADKEISHSKEKERVAKQKEKTMKASNAASNQFVKASQLHAKRAKADHDIMKARRGEPIGETTSAGAVAAVSMPIGSIQRRIKKKTK